MMKWSVCLLALFATSFTVGDAGSEPICNVDYESESCGQSESIKKIDYTQFMEGNDASRELIYAHLQDQRMVVVTNVPGMEELRKRHFQNIPSIDSAAVVPGMPFSVGLAAYPNMKSVMSNHYAANYLDQLATMNIDPESVIDLTADAMFSDELIELKLTTEEIFQKLNGISLQLFKQLSHKFNGTVRTTTGRVVTLEDVIEHSEAHKSRSIFIPAVKKVSPETAVAWHYDIVPLSVHIRDVYFDESGTEVDSPPRSGLQIRKSNGEDVFVRLLAGEVMMQAGVALRVYTGGLCEAQAHRVVTPTDPSVGRMSHILFVQPQFDSLLVPFDGVARGDSDVAALVASNPVDRSIIPLTFDILNHWAPDIPWVVAHQNQMQQFSLGGAIKVGDAGKKFLDQFAASGFLVSFYHFSHVASTTETLRRWKTAYVTKSSIVAIRADEVGSESEWPVLSKGNLYLSMACRLNSSVTNEEVLSVLRVSVVSTLSETILDSGQAQEADIVDLVGTASKFISLMTADSDSISGGPNGVSLFRLTVNVNLNFLPGVPGGDVPSMSLKDVTGVAVDPQQWGIKLLRKFAHHLPKRHTLNVVAL